MADMAMPDDLVLVGHVVGAYGLKGWVRIKPYSVEAEALLHARTWWLNKPHMHDVEVLQVKRHADSVAAIWMGMTERDAAQACKGAAVYVARKYFPALPDNEFYWVDLIGLAVGNVRGEPLGTVAGLMDNGAHPVLRVRALSSADGERHEWLIPFVEQFIIEVDQRAKKIVVDWERDY